MDCQPSPIHLGQMARRLGVTSRWLRAECEAGRVPHLKAEDRFLFDPDAVERVLLERARQCEASITG